MTDLSRQGTRNGTSGRYQLLRIAKTPGSAGDFVDLVVAVLDLLADRKHAEEFVTAGDAAESRNTQGPPQGSAEAIGELAGDTLDFNIAADGAVSDEQVCEWCSA